MNEDDFEELVIYICNHILGEGTIPFAQGKDGGKDGRFYGKANCIPSMSAPWQGKVIIQAKHTIKENASCSESEFNTIIKNSVIPAIKKLQADNEIDFYLLFTNRKLSGIQDSVILKHIEKETSIPCLLFAEEKIQSLLSQYPDVVRSAQLNRLLLPLEFDESDMKDVILLMHKEFKNGKYERIKESFDYPGLDKKNELNKLSKEYFETTIQRSMSDFDRIRVYLTDPINDDVADIYSDAANELNAKISLRREQYYEFEQLLESCYDLIVSKNADVLKGKRTLVRTVLHYMYCNCDLGRKHD